MKHLATSLLLSFGLSPVFASAQDFTSGTSNSFQQHPIVLAGPLVAAVRINVPAVETTTVRAEWSKEADLVNGSISKAKLTKMKVVTGALVDFLKDSCLNAGIYSPTWHGEYFSDKNSPGSQLKFGLTCHFADQNADLSITANDIEPLLDQTVVNGKHFLTMRVASGFDKNAFYYTDARGTDTSAGSTKMWLITANNGQLPFTPVSRKEYLNEAKAELMAMVRSIETGWKLKVPVRPAAAQEAERKAVVDQLKSMYSGADLDIRVRVYLRSYKTDEQFLQENIDHETAGFRATIRVMDSLMAHLGAVELTRPAVVSVAAADFHGFEDGQSNYMLIRVNPAYFNNSLSEEKPQVFLVTWHYNGSNASAADLDRQLTERLDGQGLQEMLCK
ncbi:MAG TPA: hypothetical protein VFE32_04845 [Puia sp.]|jgi:hypothetical protein|nr:hypothetical protein [Puia sp.]